MADVARAAARLAPAGSQRGAATSSHASALRLTTTTSAPACAKAVRHREAEAPGAAGDDGHAAGQVEQLAQLGSGLTLSAGSLARRPPPWASGSGTVLRCARRRAGVPAPVSSKPPCVGDGSRDGARVEQQVEVTEHLPDDQQRLLAHRARRPQARRDLVGASRGPRLERGDDPRAAALVVGEAPPHQPRVRRRRVRRGRSAAARAASRAVRRRFARYSTRARGRVPVGLRRRVDLGVGGDAGQQVVADEREPLALVDEQRVGGAVAGPATHAQVAPAGADRLAVARAAGRWRTAPTSSRMNSQKPRCRR